MCALFAWVFFSSLLATGTGDNCKAFSSLIPLEWTPFFLCNDGRKSATFPTFELHAEKARTNWDGVFGAKERQRNKNTQQILVNSETETI